MKLRYAFAYFPWTNCQLGCSSLFVCAIVRFLLEQKTITGQIKEEVDELQTIEYKKNYKSLRIYCGTKNNSTLIIGSVDRH